MGQIGITTATLGNPGFAEAIGLAADAGFDLLSIWPGPTYSAALAAGESPSEMRQRLADAGIALHDVDAIVVWAGPGDPGPPYLEEASVNVVLEAAAALEARYINALVVGSSDNDDCAAAFADICDQAAEVGLCVTLEFGPHRAVTDLAHAVAVVEAAGRVNGSVLYDTWHGYWAPRPTGPIGADAAAHVSTIQINDAPRDRPVDLATATRHHRLPPGAGCIPLDDVIASLRAGGSAAPLIVEVFNAELRNRLGVEAFAREMHDAARSLDDRHPIRFD